LSRSANEAPAARYHSDINEARHEVSDRIFRPAWWVPLVALVRPELLLEINTGSRDSVKESDFSLAEA
jgi:hypothetical protein